MNDCLFCKIISGELPSTKVFENEFVFAFRDIEPQAPSHILVVPKKHFSNLMELQEADGKLLAEIFTSITKIAKQEGFADEGFRVVINTGKNGQQSVEHLHFHVLGGRMLSWPPG